MCFFPKHMQKRVKNTFKQKINAKAHAKHFSASNDLKILSNVINLSQESYRSVMTLLNILSQFDEANSFA